MTVNLSNVSPAPVRHFAETSQLKPLSHHLKQPVVRDVQANDVLSQSKNTNRLFTIAKDSNQFSSQVYSNSPSESKAPISQYLQTTNISKREALESIVGVDIYV